MAGPLAALIPLIGGLIASSKSRGHDYEDTVVRMIEENPKFMELPQEERDAQFQELKTLMDDTHAALVGRAEEIEKENPEDLGGLAQKTGAMFGHAMFRDHPANTVPMEVINYPHRPSENTMNWRALNHNRDLGEPIDKEQAAAMRAFLDVQYETLKETLKRGL